MEADLDLGPRLSQVERFVAGACAGVANKTSTAPLDRIRILFQVNRHREFTWSAFILQGKKIIRKEGALGLWRGNTMSVVRVIPYGGVQFTSFDFANKSLRAVPVFQSAKNEELRRFFAGAIAGTTATVTSYPLDFLRARMAVTQSSLYLGPRYDSYFHAIGEIYYEEGVFAFFRGIGPTLAGIIPSAGISFMVFETLKPWLQAQYRLESEKDLPIAARLFAGGMAGLIAQTSCYPLQVVRRRMQVQGSVGHAGEVSAEYRSVLHAVVSIQQKEGLIRGLYKGASLTMVKGPLGAAVSFCTNDLVKQFLQRQRIQASRRGNSSWYADVSTEPPVPAIERRDKPTLLEHLIPGGCAGACAKTVIAPGDRMKILYQTNPKRKFTWRKGFGTIVNIYRNSGITGLFRGHSATLMRVVPFASINFTMFDVYHKALHRHRLDVYDLIESPTGGTEPRPSRDVTRRFLAGAMSGATASACTYPLELMRARMAAHWDISPKYPNYLTGFANIIRDEGMLSLWKGLRPTLLGIMPYSGLSFMTFETLKAQVKKLPGSDNSRIQWLLRPACGAVAGLVGQAATYPLDILRRRMQVHPGLYKNELDAMRTIYRNEGLRGGLFKGVTVNFLKGPLAVSVSFTVNDFMKHLIGIN